MLNVAVGHFISCLTGVLGDFSSVTAIMRSQYSNSLEVENSGAPTGRTLEKTCADQIAFSGILKSGVVVSVHCRGGHPSTKGRSPFIWIVDGEGGSIKMQSDEPGGSFINVRSPCLYLNGEEVKVQEGEDNLGNIGRSWLEFSKGAQGDYPSFEDAVRIHRVLEAISRSAKEGRRIDLD
jgi:predicted dehydrogenase